MNLSVSKLFHSCWMLFFSVIFAISLCLSFSYSGKRSSIVELLLLVLILYMYLKIYDRLRNRIEMWSNRKYNICVSLIFITHILLLLAAGRLMLVKPFNDTATIWFSAADIVESGSVSKEINEFTGCAWSTHTSNHDYLLIYPNSQILVASLLPLCTFIYKALGISLRTYPAYYIASVYNVMLIAVSELFCYLTVKKLRGRSGGILLLVLSTLFLPYYLHSFKLYSDTMSMPFVSLTFLLIVCADKSETTKKRLFYHLAAGIGIGLGSLLKGSLLILFISVGIYLFAAPNLGGGWRLRKRLPSLLVLTVGFLAVNLAWNMYSEDIYWLDKSAEDRYALPNMHWIMMASVDEGGFRQSDLEYTMQFDSLQEKREKTKEEYISRVKEHGTLGYLKFMATKICRALVDGTYFQIAHLYEMSSTPCYFLLNPEGFSFKLIKLYCNTFQLGLLSVFLMSAAYGVRHPNGILFLFNISMLGIILFFSLWECKSRYLLNYTPMFLTYAAIAADGGTAFLKKAVCGAAKLKPV